VIVISGLKDDIDVDVEVFYIVKPFVWILWYMAFNYYESMLWNY